MVVVAVVYLVVLVIWFPLWLLSLLISETGTWLALAGGIFWLGRQLARYLSYPGCFATAGQLALRPLVDDLAEAPHGFGVSGYSGAGRTPSPRNDPEALANGVTPYKLVHHTHEREMSRHLDTPVRFSPHVAPFFRGITFTVQAKLQHETSEAELLERAHAHAA